MSGGNGTNVPLKTSAKSKSSTPMKDFFTLGKKIFNEKEIANFDQQFEARRQLEDLLQQKTQELVVKEQEIKSLRTSKDEEIREVLAAKETLFLEFQSKYKAWDIGTTRQTEFDIQVAELKLQLKQANQRANSSGSQLTVVQEQLTDCQNRLNGTRKELGSKERELIGTVNALENCQGALHKERKHSGLDHLDLGILTIKFDRLAKECHELAKCFFLTQLPQDLAPHDLWSQLDQSGFSRIAPKTIPRSDSMASRYLRMATVEKMIAEKLCSKIFQQYYLPYSIADRHAIDEILERCHKDNPYKEALFRSQLLSAYKSDEQPFVESLVESTTGDLTQVIAPLFFTTGGREKFTTSLGKLFHTAIKLWKLVQKSDTRGLANNDPEETALDDGQKESWEENEEYSSAVKLSAEQRAHHLHPADHVMSLFPRILIGSKLVYRGCALWSDQSVVVAASEESFAQGPGGITRRDSNRRRLSSSGSIGGGSVVGVSSTKSSGKQSFSERANSRNMPLLIAQRIEPGGNSGAK